MKKYCVLYNPVANNKQCEMQAKKLDDILSGDELTYTDVTSITDYAAFIKELPEDCDIIVCGGDGTLNVFANSTDGVEIKQNILYYACGSGNDFLRDIGDNDGKPVEIKKYLENLPSVTVQGKTYKFINGVGYGIDGYCCEEGDRIREKSDKPINYTSIAIKGLLFRYKPTDAVVTVDGKEYNFKKVWIAPTMHGRYYGGGMLPAPEQARGTDKLSVTVFHGSGKLKTLMIFPSIFNGGHVKNKKYVTVMSGKTISVKFAEPRALQIDGETILGVTEYTAKI